MEYEASELPALMAAMNTRAERAHRGEVARFHASDLKNGFVL